ncbi:MAG: hypothetical protein ABSB71_11305 [Candidatus Bathyarchaeia archaeon]
MIFAVSRKVLEALLADPVWLKRAQDCQNFKDLQKVIVDFGMEKGFVVKDLDKQEVAA